MVGLRSTTRTIATTGLFLAAIVAGAAPLPPPAQPALHFPTRVGTRWVYATPDGDRSETITASVPAGDDRRVTIEAVEGVRRGRRAPRPAGRSEGCVFAARLRRPERGLGGS
jgi:hypothetical protein